MPGIIDTHSHIAIQGGVNEMSLSIVPEVRVKDVVTGDDPAIYRALAGGTTTARLLHGSANTIGGQDAVIKLALRPAGPRPDRPRRPPGGEVRPRRERDPVARPVPEHPDGRRGDDRAGLRGGQGLPGRVEGVRGRRRKDPAKAGPPPRRDLRLEALARHPRRLDQDPQPLLPERRDPDAPADVAERYGVRVQSLQHVLEGYKVAAEIAAHGASASTFSDWWAYKVEAFDAIPFNAALLTRGRGQRLHQERQRGADPPPQPRGRQDGQVRRRDRGPGPGDDHDQPGPRARARRPARLDRGGQGRRHRPLQRPPVRRLRPLRAGPDRRRGLLPAARAGRQVRRPARRPRDDARAPTPRRGAGRSRSRPSPRGSTPWSARPCTRSAGPTIANGTLVVADGKIAAIGGRRARRSRPRPRRSTCAGLDVWPGLIDAGLAARPLRDRQPPRDAGLRRRRPQFQPELRTSIGPAPRQRADPRDPGQRRPDRLRPADRRARSPARAA